jgi:hypothetical protein
MRSMSLARWAVPGALRQAAQPEGQLEDRRQPDRRGVTLQASGMLRDEQSRNYDLISFYKNPSSISPLTVSLLHLSFL